MRTTDNWRPAPLLTTVVLALLLAGASTRCSSSRLLAPATIRLKGSDTMLILAQRWGEEYMKQQAGIAVYVEGGGTAKGVEALIKGEIDICMASRPMSTSEARRLLAEQGSVGISHLIAKDALSIYLHPDNPVRDLTLEQLRYIFTGKITSWQELGGPDTPVLVFGRSPNSGTYLYFQEHVLGGQPYSSNMQTLASTSAIVNAVGAHTNAIGYGGIAHGPQLVHCRINGVAPTAENVRNNTYAIARYLYFYTRNKPHGVSRAFIDWVLSRAGQAAVQQAGYVPLLEMP